MLLINATSLAAAPNPMSINAVRDVQVASSTGPLKHARSHRNGFVVLATICVQAAFVLPAVIAVSKVPEEEAGTSP